MIRNYPTLANKVYIWYVEAYYNFISLSFYFLSSSSADYLFTHLRNKIKGIIYFPFFSLTKEIK